MLTPNLNRLGICLGKKRAEQVEVNGLSYPRSRFQPRWCCCHRNSWTLYTGQDATVDAAIIMA